MKKIYIILAILLISIFSLFPYGKTYAVENTESTEDTDSDLITITYWYEGKTKTVTIHAGETLDIWIPDDEMDGLTLAYWITNPGAMPEERNIITSDTVFYEDTTLYPVWNDPVVEPPNENHPVLDQDSAQNLYPPKEESTDYAVTFDGCNGRYLITLLVKKNTAIGSFPSRPKKDGYFFLGWFTQENGGTQLTHDTIITSDMTVYAHWEQIEEGYYIITFDKNDGTKDSTYCIWLTTEIVGDENVPREGYIFKGWYTKKTGGKKVVNGTKPTSDMTLYAHWEKVTVKKSSIKNTVRQNFKTMTVTFKKVPKAEGYQIQYSTSRKFTKKTTKTVNVKGNKTFTRKLKKLKKKTYYIRVRAYKTDSTKAKIYGSWSKVKKVKRCNVV